MHFLKKCFLFGKTHLINAFCLEFFNAQSHNGIFTNPVEIQINNIREVEGKYKFKLNSSRIRVNNIVCRCMINSTVIMLCEIHLEFFFFLVLVLLRLFL